MQNDEIATLKAELERRKAEAERQFVEAEMAKRRLSSFLKQAWHVVETTSPLMWSWHLDAMCEHLEAVTSGQIKNLCITIPPGCTKSILVSVMWPAWTWASNPGVRWLCAANESDLATRDSLSCRKVLQSDWYQSRFPNVQLVSDQNVKTWYQTKEGGHRLATTVSSNVTGKKGDILLCFPGDTMIQTESGQVAISEIADNPTEYRVATYNHETDAIEYHTPSRSFHNETQELIVIETDDGREIECTPDHPVYVVGKGYIPATLIESGDKVIVHDSV